MVRQWKRRKMNLTQFHTRTQWLSGTLVSKNQWIVNNCQIKQLSLDRIFHRLPKLQNWWLSLWLHNLFSLSAHENNMWQRPNLIELPSRFGLLMNSITESWQAGQYKGDHVGREVFRCENIGSYLQKNASHFYIFMQWFSYTWSGEDWCDLQCMWGFLTHDISVIITFLEANVYFDFLLWDWDGRPCKKEIMYAYMCVHLLQ